jgi:hypothetical protein
MNTIFAALASLLMLYVPGVIITFIFHLHSLQMVTPGLAALHSLAWPVAVITGHWWPHGVPLPMD